MDLLQNEQTGLQNSKGVQPHRERKIMSIFPSFSADRGLSGKYRHEFPHLQR